MFQICPNSCGVPIRDLLRNCPVARIRDRDEGEQVARDSKEDVECLEDQGDGVDIRRALEDRVAVLWGVVTQAQVAVLNDARLVAHRHF